MTQATGALRYVVPINGSDGRVLAQTPDGKWIIEVRFERRTTEEVNVAGHTHQLRVLTSDTIKTVECVEAVHP